MLREHGSQRPTVFELLNHVHRLRGTKSKFAYNIPVPPPLLPHGHPQAKPSPPLNPLDGLVTYGFPPAKSALSIYDMNAPSNPPNQGVQAREKVLEAIAPMRRGRPTASKESLSTSRPPTPPRHSQSRSEYSKDWPDNGFGPEQDKAWKAATEKYSSSSHAKPSIASDETWNLGELDQNLRKEKKDRPTGFGDDFAQKLWNSQDPNSPTPRLSPRPNMNVLKPNDTPLTPLMFTGTSKIRPKQDRLQQKKDKDAFEGLGLMAAVPKTAPTLGEARKLRTGLATMSTSANLGDYRQREHDKAQPNLERPSPSPQPRYLSTTPVHTQSISPVPTPGGSSFKLSPYATSMARASPSAKADGPIESRFPSLEELDAQFKPVANSLYPSSVIEATSKYVPQSAPATRSESRPFYSSRTSNIGTSGTGGNLLKPTTASTVSSHSVDGVRSQQVTGIAMRETKESRRADDSGAEPQVSELDRDNGAENSPAAQSSTEMQPKPMLLRKHRSSVTMKPGSKAETPDSNDSLAPPKLPPRPSATPPRDWLTGEDHNDISTNISLSDVPILRESPSKRASFVEKSDFRIPSSTAAQHEYAPERFVNERQSVDLSPTVSNFKRAFPAIEKFDAESQSAEKSLSSVPKESRSPSVPRKEVDVDSSSADEEPEDPRSITSSAQKRQVSRRKGRQSSVHELVYQYGGSLPAKEKEREKDKDKGREWQPSPYSVGDYVPRKARLSLAPPASTSVLDRKTPSPTNYSFNRPPSSTSNYPPRQQSAALEDKLQPSMDGAKPAIPTRSRPQSMFIFPSKSVDSSSTPTSNNLAPPQEPKPRAVRRTSISDMVQKYEAIGGARGAPKSPNSLAPGPPSPIHRPISTKSNSASAENGRVHKPFPDKKLVISSKTSMSSDTSSRSTGGDPLKSRTTMNEPVRQATQLSRTPTKTHHRMASEKGKSIMSQGVDNTPRPRRISVKAEATTKSAFVRTDTGTGRPAKLESSSGPSSSPRKPLISLTTDEGTAKVEEPSRSPSPERPYQGVGRLIDQWQKKSAEAEQGRPAGKFVPKRAGIVPVDDR